MKLNDMELALMVSEKERTFTSQSYFQLLALENDQPKPCVWATLGKSESTLRQETHVINLASLIKMLTKLQPQCRARTKGERMRK